MGARCASEKERRGEARKGMYTGKERSGTINERVDDLVKVEERACNERVMSR